jgi:hypothetical protein
MAWYSTPKSNAKGTSTARHQNSVLLVIIVFLCCGFCFKCHSFNVLCPMFPMSLDCPFLIASQFSQTFIYEILYTRLLAKVILFLFLIRHPPYVTHIVKSGVIVIDNITCRKLSLDVYSILSYLLRSVVYCPMFPMSLDCPFLIASQFSQTFIYEILYTRLSRKWLIRVEGRYSDI